MAKIDINGCVSAFIKLATHIKNNIMSSLITILFVILILSNLGQLSIEDRFYDFFFSGVQRSLVEYEKKNIQNFQIELHNTVERDKVINQNLKSLLDSIPSAVRARVAIVHDGVTTALGSHLSRFDITHSVARSGRDPGEFLTNVPFAQWQDYSPDLFAGKCKFVTVTNMENAAAKDRLSQLSVRAFMVCPLITVYGQLLGAVFVSWDEYDKLPVGLDQKFDIESKMKLTAAAITTSFEIVGIRTQNNITPPSIQQPPKR